jgi:hypothetical protein
MVDHRKELLGILRAAHAGEMAAAFAYRGHWKAVTAPDEVEAIRRIETDEWRHRKDVRRMLQDLGADPQPLREVLMWTIGRTVGLMCHVTGWFFPMYIAGRLEYGNVDEYDRAAFHAAKLGLEGLQQELLAMTLTEKEHELFFMAKVVGHPLLPIARFLFRWGPTQADLLALEKRVKAVAP